MIIVTRSWRRILIAIVGLAVATVVGFYLKQADDKTFYGMVDQLSEAPFCPKDLRDIPGEDKVIYSYRRTHDTNRVYAAVPVSFESMNAWLATHCRDWELVTDADPETVKMMAQDIVEELMYDDPVEIKDCRLIRYKDNGLQALRMMYYDPQTQVLWLSYFCPRKKGDGSDDFGK